MTTYSLLADADLLVALGASLPPRVESLRRRTTTTAAAVAVVGLFSRGKSTLFNHLVGAEVAQTGALPTTKVLTEASTGQRFAAASWGGHSKQLPLDPAAFTAAIGAMGDPYPERVEFSGPLRLPAGMRLVDTPGAGAVSDLAERDWYLSGAGAALLVLAFPPGPQGEDWELLEALDDVFPNAVAIVVKATDADVDRADLEEVAARAAANSGRAVMPIPLEPPTGGWGEDPEWQQVEDVLAELEGRARATVIGARADLRAWLDDRFASLCSEDLSPEGAALVAADSVLAPGVSAAASAAVERLGVEVRQQRIREAQRAAERHELERAKRSHAFAPRRAIGERLLDEANWWRTAPYERLRLARLELRSLIDRMEQWQRGRTDLAELEDLEGTIDTALAALVDQHGALAADELIEQGQALAAPHHVVPMDAHRDVERWLDASVTWLTTLRRGPQCEVRAVTLQALLRRAGVPAPPPPSS